MGRVAEEVEWRLVEEVELRIHATVLIISAAMRAVGKFTKDEVSNRLMQMKVRRYFNTICTPAHPKTIEAVCESGGSISTLTVSAEGTTVSTRSKKN